ncbi:MAG: Nudix family hydrolase [Nitrosospira sp.]|nr:Nudix family hydrolase [Nitrosospira sp.]
MVEVAAAVITRPDGSFLLARRPKGKPYAGYWEFPGGKAESDEPMLHALRRELREELAINVEHVYPWITRTFTYSHATVRLHFYRVMQWRGEPRPCEKQELSWQFAGSAGVEPMLPANTPVLRALDLPPVYAITNAAGEENVSLAQIERALQEGVRLLQVREKSITREALEAFTSQIINLAQAHGAKVLVNTGTASLDFCRAVAADGIHFPSSQLMSLTRRPDFAWCGASCHNAEELSRAEGLGLDFAVLGPILPTLSHPGAATLGWRKFASLIRGCSIPVYALGGLRPEDLTTAWEHGSHGIALMRGIADWKHGSIKPC